MLEVCHGRRILSSQLGTALSSTGEPLSLLVSVGKVIYVQTESTQITGQRLFIVRVSHFGSHDKSNMVFLLGMTVKSAVEKKNNSNYCCAQKLLLLKKCVCLYG